MVSVLTEKLVLTFDSVNYAMQAEKAFKEDEVEFKTIPTPREISSSCGLSIVTSLDNTEYASKKKKDGLNINQLWKHTKSKAGKSAELIE